MSSLVVAPIFVLGVVSSLLSTAGAEVNHCSENHLPEVMGSPPSELQFTKELADREFSVDSHFRSLHCCAKGYLSIEWFKDGRPYPWPGDVSSFILYPQSANQTVYTKSLRISDAGNYTCRIHNSTHVQLHNTELKVFDEASGYMELPLATYRPPAVSLAAEGSISRLFCEAFVGHIDLPDAASEVKWEKKGNATFEAPHIELIDVKREREIVGKYLLINNVDPSDFGTYYCTISNTGDQKIVMETVLKPLNGEEDGFCLTGQITLILLLITVPIAAVLIYFLLKSLISRRFWSKITEYNPFSEKKVPKLSLVILYNENDYGFVEESLRQTAYDDGSVYLFLQKLKTDGELPEETKNLCSKIGKIVIVLSRNLVPNWTKTDIEETLERMILPDKTYSIILLEMLPEALAVPKKRLNVFGKSDPLLWQKLKEANLEQQQPNRPLARLSSRLTGTKIVEVHV